MTGNFQVAVSEAAPTPPVGKDPGVLSRVAVAARRDWLVWVISLGVFANGSVNTMAALRFYHPARRFLFILPFGFNEFNRTASVVLGFTLVFFSFHLLRRRMMAWWLGAITLAALTIIHVVWRHHAYLAVGSAIMFALLLVARRRFTVKSEPRSILAGIRLMVITLFVAVLWGTIAFYLLDERDFGREFGFWDALVRTLRQFVLIGNHDLTPLTRAARWFPRIMGALGVTAEVFALFSLFRPLAHRVATEPHERRRALAIVAEYGRSAYDHFKVWPDKSLYFAATGSFVAYRVHHGVALSLGDPVGPPEELEAAIRDFVDYSRNNGWVPAFIMPERIEPYRHLGLWSVKVGEEATVDLEHFEEVTSRNKYFRYVRRQIEGQGIEYGRSLPPHSPQLLDEVEELSAKWLKQPRYREFGFMQGTFSRGYLEDVILDVLHDKDGRLIAFVSEVPSHRPGEANFDLMQRLPESHWAIMDYLFLRLMLTLRAEGYRAFNLGLAPFAGVGDDPESTLIEKTIRGVAPYAERLVRWRGLTQYKKKFEPSWEDRFFVYDGGPLLLPQVALAMTTVV